MTFTADLGQGEELEPGPQEGGAARHPRHPYRGPSRGVRPRLRLPDVRMNASTRASTCSAPRSPRPLIAKRLVEIAHETTGADAIADGATVEGQRPGPASNSPPMRSTRTSRCHRPGRRGEWNVLHRPDRLRRAAPRFRCEGQARRGAFLVMPTSSTPSSEGKVLEDRWVEPPPYVFQRTVAPEDAPDRATYCRDRVPEGDPVAIDGKAMSPATLSSPRTPCCQRR